MYEASSSVSAYEFYEYGVTGEMSAERINYSENKEGEERWRDETLLSERKYHTDTVHRKLARKRRVGKRLGQSDTKNATQKLIKGSFHYHGDETTAPPEDIALGFARHLPYKPGMPGPSFTYTAYATAPKEALDVLRTGRVLALITERLDESLVVASHFLGISLADVVLTKHRKALSKHPKQSDWPASAIHVLNQTLNSNGEMEYYHGANHILDFRIKLLRQEGVDFDAELQMLKDMRERVTKVCLSEEYLEVYRKHLNGFGLSQHSAGGTNRLRDTEDKFAEGGHSFSLNREILYSYDVCGGCEAHALLYSVKNKLVSSISEAPLLRDLDTKHRTSNLDFLKCP
eukprot:CAMPEP_0182424526 /NCGR_PEP_ID=MMETSP1167-20130531/10729_1 /TAXON_ID=2988 /ORGANISM="Mallomonas Sp, Strain CCMP3275" /LENGTH=344 /DNA_ID=CAMNT_0024604397 /DNA_START=919 /DNA_END=1956 /DNA_ORIENTATION=+